MPGVCRGHCYRQRRRRHCGARVPTQSPRASAVSSRSDDPRYPIKRFLLNRFTVHRDATCVPRLGLRAAFYRPRLHRSIVSCPLLPSRRRITQSNADPAIVRSHPYSNAPPSTASIQAVISCLLRNNLTYLRCSSSGNPIPLFVLSSRPHTH